MTSKEIVKSVRQKSSWLQVSLYACATLVVISRLSIPLFIKLYIGGNMNGIVAAICIMLAAILSFIMEALKDALASSYGASITTELSAKTFECALKADNKELLKLSKSEKEVDTIGFLDEAIKSCQKIGTGYYGKSLVTLYTNLLYLAGSCILLMVLENNFILGLIVLLSLPIFWGLTEVFSAKENRGAKIMEDLREKGEKKTAEDLENIRVFKIRGASEAKEKEFANLMENISQETSKIEISHSLSANAMNSFFIGFIIALGILATALLLENKEGDSIVINKGALVAFLYLVPTCYASAKNIMGLPLTSKYVENEMAFIDRVLVLRSERQTEEENQELDIEKISFDKVSSKAKNPNDDITQISFTVEKNQSLGIYCEDGRGCQTLFDLLLKLDRPNIGHINCNDINLARISDKQYRKQISAAEEALNLLPSSIEDNIIFPEERDDYRFNETLRLLDLREYIVDLPLKDKTLVTALDPKAPEIRKIALANALYRDTQVFILCDALEDLDSLEEKRILNEILNMKNKMVIYISKRKEVATLCDKLLVLNEGRVIYDGTSSEYTGDNPKKRPRH